MTASPPREIQVAWARTLILRLKQERGFNIQLSTWDTYASAESRQQLAREGVETGTLSVDLRSKTASTWGVLRDLASARRIRLPGSALMISELEGLTLMPNGKVDHPPGLTKDIADAVAGAVHGALTFAESSAEDGTTVGAGSSGVILADPVMVGGTPLGMTPGGYDAGFFDGGIDIFGGSGGSWY